MSQTGHSALPASPPPRAPRGGVLTVCRVGFIGGAERVALAAVEAAAGDGRGAVLACPAEGALASEAQARGLHVRTLGMSRGRPDSLLAGWPGQIAAIHKAR